MTDPDDADIAVARVRAELAALPGIPMPPDVAARTRRAALSAQSSSQVSSRKSSTGRERTWGRRAASRVTVLAGAAAALFLFLAPPGDRPAPIPVGREDDLRAAGAVAFGRDGAGPLADPVRRRACLTTAGVADPDATLVGGAPYTVAGTSGTLVVLGSGVVGRYRLVVVDDGCRLLAGTTVGR